MVFSESASNLLVASDGSGGSRDTPKSLRQVAFEVATFSLQILSGSSVDSASVSQGGQVPGRQILWQSPGEPFKLSVVLTKRPTSSF